MKEVLLTVLTYAVAPDTRGRIQCRCYRSGKNATIVDCLWQVSDELENDFNIALHYRMYQMVVCAQMLLQSQ